LETRKKIVLLTGMFLVLISVLSISLYPVLPEPLQRSFFFYLLVVSAWTSLAGCYWALYSVWKFYKIVEQTREEVEHKLGLDTIRAITPVLRRAEERFDALTPEQKTQLIGLLNRGIDLAFSKLEGLVEKPPIEPPKGLRRR